MDAYESTKALDRNGPTHRSRTREVSSRYRSPTPSSPSGPKCCPSLNVIRTTSTSTVSAPKRAVSVERKRPITPSRPQSPSPSTPVRDTTAESLLVSNKTVANNKFPESLWPSTMRSLSNSFQSGALSVRTGKEEKTVIRKRSPLKGKNSDDQLENSKPVDILRHQWPSRASVKTSTALNKTDVTDKMAKSLSLSRPRMVTPSARRLSLDGTSKPLQKSASDLLMQISRDDIGTEGFYGNSIDGRSVRTQRPGSSSSPRGSRPASPSVSRGVSPSRAKPINISSRGTSPARVRPSSPSRNPQNSSSVLSFIADIKKGKTATNDIEDAHQLRLLYNRHLQWQFANARTDAALRSQKMKAERMLYDVRGMIVDLLDAVMEKRSDLRDLKLKLKLYSVLENHVSFLDEWASMERDHTNSLTWAIQDLEATTVRIPVTGGARADIKTVKAAVCSAVDVMSSMGSSLCSILSQVEGMNCLVSELADVSALERAVLDECESLLGSTAALQVEEYSLRTHLLQMQQAWKHDEQSVFGY